MQQQTQHRKAETKENLLAESVTLEACWRRSRRGNAYLVGNFRGTSKNGCGCIAKK